MLRAALEDRLPEAGRAVRDSLLADGSVAEAVRALEACLLDVDDDASVVSYDDPDERGGERGGEDDEDDEPGPLDALCARACMHAHDHLQHLASTWRAHLHEVHAETRRLADEMSRRTAEVAAVRARYHARAPEIVEAEYRIEMARLRSALDDALRTVRAAPPPRVPRPEELDRATRALREAFAEGHGGRLPSRGLRRRHLACERQLRRVQRAVGEDFVRHATRAWLA
jgi:hypothetical protein